MIQNCVWNNEPFECCEGFLPLETEFGLCYTINSAITRYVCSVANRDKIIQKKIFLYLFI